MDTGLATKLIRYYKWKWADTDPKNTAAKSSLQMYADDIRRQVGDMNFMKNDDNYGWSPNSEDWTDVYDYAKSSGHNDIIDWINANGLHYSQATPTVSKVNNPMQASTALASSGQQDTTGIYTGAAIGYQPPVSTQESSGGSVSSGGSSNMSNGGTNQPSSYDPIAETNKTIQEYKDMALRAGQADLNAQLAQAQWTINNGGVWKVLQPIAQKQMQDALTVLEKTAAIARANIEASRASLNAEEAANYDAAIGEIDRNLVASRKRTIEEMNQRGMFFSTVLDSVLGQVEAASATQRGLTSRQHMVNLAKIAAKMAELSGNIDIETIRGNAAAVAQYTATMLQVVAQDEQTKQTAQALIAGLEEKQKGLVDTIGMSIFSTIQDLKQQGKAEATQMAETEWNNWLAGIGQYANDYQAEINNQQAIINDPNSTPEQKSLAAKKITALQAARTNLAETDWNNWLAGIGQYANNYQAEINNQQAIISDPNSTSEQKTLAAKKITALQQARTSKLSTDFETWKATTNMYANDYQAAINALNPSDPLYAQKKSYLIGLRLEKIAQIAKTNTAQAQQELDNAFKERQINLQEYQAMTARINALGGGGSGTSGTTSKPAWTNAQARSFKAEYEKVMNMPIGTTIDSSVAGALAGSGVNLNVGDTWTPESRDAYLKQNKSLYDSAINFINTNDTSLWNPNNPQLSTTFRAMLQGMIDNGIMITEDNILKQIEAQGDYITPSGTPTGAEYEFLLAEFERLRNK